MLDAIRYRLLMLQLRKDIARTVRDRTAPAQNAQIVVKSSCKVCGSIV